MNVLVTGGAGFIGSNLVEALLRRGHAVRVIDNFSTGKRGNLAPFRDDVELIEGDIRSYHLVSQAVKGMEVVLHQAALPSVPRSIADPITSNEVNVAGTLNMLEAAREHGVRRVVYASSSSVYGDNPELPKHEGLTPNPLSPYAVSKLAGERYCSVFYRLYGLETISLRYFNVFGPRQDPASQYSAVIPRFITAMLAGVPPVIYGDGTQSRDFTYVENVVHANLLAAESSDGVGMAMNCAGHRRITLADLVERINATLGTAIFPTHEAPRPGDIPHSYADIGAISRNLHYEPLVGFEEGLERTVAHYTTASRLEGGPEC